MIRDHSPSQLVMVHICSGPIGDGPWRRRVRNQPTEYDAPAGKLIPMIFCQAPFSAVLPRVVFDCSVSTAQVQYASDGPRVPHILLP